MVCLRSFVTILGLGLHPRQPCPVGASLPMAPLAIGTHAGGEMCPPDLGLTPESSAISRSPKWPKPPIPLCRAQPAAEADQSDRMPNDKLERPRRRERQSHSARPAAAQAHPRLHAQLPFGLRRSQAATRRAGSTTSPSPRTRPPTIPRSSFSVSPRSLPKA